MSHRASSDKIANAGVVVLAMCAVFVTVSRFARGGSAPPVATPASFVGDWNRYAEAGHAIGPAGAAVTIVEFSDFQCPFCAQLTRTLHTLRTQYPENVRVIFRHFPISDKHPRAEELALAAECGSEQDQFEAVHDTLFAWQPRLDSLRLNEVVAAAGVKDIAAFQRCLATRRYANRLQADTDAGRRLLITGTPTLLVNGTRYLGNVGIGVLDSIVRDALKRRLQQ